MSRVKLLRICMGMCIVIMASSVCGCGNKSSKAEQTVEEVTESADSEADEKTGDEAADGKSGEASGDKAEEENKDVSLAGTWEFTDLTPAGDAAVYQFIIDADGKASFAQYVPADGSWMVNFTYEGDVSDSKALGTDESDTEKVKDEESQTAKSYVNLNLAAHDENGNETEKISGKYQADIAEDTPVTDTSTTDTSTGETLTLTLVDGDPLMSQHFYEPVIFTKVTDGLKDGVSIGNSSEPGAYYDWYVACNDIAWKDTYREKLSDIYNGNIDDIMPYYGLTPSDEEYEMLRNCARSDTYYIYDIDKDDVPELIVKYGTCEADYLGIVYKYENYQAVIMYDFGLGHKVLYSDPEGDGIIVQMAHMGYNSIYRMKYVGGDFEVEDIFEEDGIESSDEYTEPGEVVSGSEYLPYITVDDNVLIDEYRK